MFRTLTEQPLEDLKYEPSTAEELVLGHMAFRYPGTLGGQAERQELSCNSCHPSGTREADFLFPGVSDKPGTADVSHALFHGPADNGSFDPVNIPSLQGIAHKNRFGTQVEKASLESFVTHVIEHEFGGQAHHWLVKGLVVYIQALQPTEEWMPVSVEDDLNWLDQYAWRLSMVRGDPVEHTFIAEATRAHIGRMASRFNGPEHTGVRSLFLYLSELLSEPPGGFGANVAIMRETLEDTRPMILEASKTSLYEKAPARQYLNERGLLR